MFKKILFFIIASNFALSSSYSNDNKICINNLDIYSQYYENNQWEFIKKELVDKVDYNSKNNLLKVFGTMTVLSFSSLGFIKKKKKGMRSFVTFYSMFSFLGFIISYLNSNAISKFFKECSLFVVIDEFFKNYSTEADSELKVNYRKFVPKELLASFDLIYETYKKEGPKSLEAFMDIFNSIRDKFSVNQ